MQKRQNYGHDPEKLGNWSDKQCKINKYVVCQSKGSTINSRSHGCKVSAIAYLRTPKHQINDRKKHFGTDGMVSFTNNSENDFHWTNPTCH